MDNSRELLIQAVHTPETIADFSLSDWDLVLRQARKAEMLSRLWHIFAKYKLLTFVPDQALFHLESARNVAKGHERSIRWEVHKVCHALKKKQIPVILLKGAAYLMAELPICKGRTFNDIDLLVDRSLLDKTEKALLLNGWVTTHHDAYDQRYFRDWMHELPPLQHIHRQSVLDVHHTILPVTARLKPNVKKLFASIVPLEENPEIFTLAPLDMILHSATHLFHEGEFDLGFRGLSDLDGLLRHFSEQRSDFWPALVERALELNLNQPLYYALTYTHTLLKTPVPEHIKEVIGRGVQKGLKANIMDFLYLRALRPYHSTCDVPFSSSARWLLYVRSHYIKMPLKLLLPHLFRKAFISEKKA